MKAFKTETNHDGVSFEDISAGKRDFVATLIKGAKHFVPSEMQGSFFDRLARNDSNIILDATAGSGKSTTIIQALTVLPADAAVLYLAFNRDAADSLGAKVAAFGAGNSRNVSMVQAKTFHSWGFAALRKAMGRVKLDDNKVRNSAQYNLSPAEYAAYGKACVNLVRLAKGEGLGALNDATRDDWQGIVSHHDIDLDSEDATWERAFEIADALMRDSISQAENSGIIDYADQLYLPVLWNLVFPKQDYLFIDEAQDSNPVRIAIASMTLAPGGRLIAVGDNDQSIAGFAGASNDAMEKIAAAFSCVTLPLTVSYRCPKSAEQYAKPYSPKFSVHPNAPEGFVKHCTVTEGAAILTDSDVILCRNTAPLIKLAYSMIKSGRGVFVKGRDIGNGLVALVGKMKAKGIDALQEKLAAYLDRETAKFLAKKQEERAASLADKVECITVLIEGLPETGRTVPALIAKIESMFDDKANGRLTLSTIHKAKGLEYTNVGIIRWDLCPSKYARQAWQQKQESNLQFVACTRHKDGLLFMADDTPKV